MSEQDGLFGAVEAGGTKFVLATGNRSGTLLERHVIPTRDPYETLQAAGAWFSERGKLEAIGIASFGPVELDPASPDWGFITETPKPGWRGTDLAGFFADRFACPVGFDTDVNGAALAEFELGAGRGLASLAYVTVGTGIGGGLVIDGRLVHGAGHPELGHIFVKREAGDDDFAGVCPFHGDCLEGLACGPAILDRWGATLSDLPPGHRAHRLVAGYLAQMCHTLFAACALDAVILGGGVMQAPGLLDRVARTTGEIGADYLPGRARQRVIAPGLGEDSGIRGALLLARAALERRDHVEDA